MVEYTEENILVRPIPYKILRQIHLSSDGSYAVQMNLKAGIDQEKASEIIELLDSIDLIYKIEGTDPQLYDVNYSQFEELFTDRWREKMSDGIDLPVHFGTFLEHYVKEFLTGEKSSSINEMLVDDFLVAFQGVKADNPELVPSNYERLINELSKYYDSKDSARKYVKHSLTNTE